LENFLAKSRDPFEKKAFVSDKETINSSTAKKGYLGLLNKRIINDFVRNTLGTEHFVDH
jgi:hypothetical protein